MATTAPNRRTRRAAAKKGAKPGLLDPSTFTLADIESLEEIAGIGLDELAKLDDDYTPPAKTLIALTFIIRRRSEPEVTPDQVRTMTINEMNEALGKALGGADGVASS